MQRSVGSRDGFRGQCRAERGRGVGTRALAMEECRVAGVGYSSEADLSENASVMGEDEAIRGSMSDSKVWGTLGQTDVFPTFGNKARGETAVT